MRQSSMLIGGAFGLVALLLICAGLALVGSLQPRPNLAADWVSLLRAAQSAVLKTDKNLVLHQVSATTVGLPSASDYYSSTFQIEFMFLRPSDHPTADAVYVTLEDVNPATTVRSGPLFTEQDKVDVSLSLEDVDQHRRALASVRIGPREAGLQTWQQARDKINDLRKAGIGTQPLVTLTLDKTPPEWDVFYQPTNGVKATSPAFAVDVLNGHILDQWDQDWPLTR